MSDEPCGCRFDDDDNCVAWCWWHAEMRDKLAAVKAERDGCICSGNWRKIIAEAEPLFGRRFDREDGAKNHRLIGVMHGDDDYYYVMSYGPGTFLLLSCVGDLETHGYKAAK